MARSGTPPRALTDLVKPAERLPLVPLIVGGDDLTVLLDGALALAFVERYLAAFATRSADQPLIQQVLGRLGWSSLTASGQDAPLRRAGPRRPPAARRADRHRGGRAGPRGPVRAASMRSGLVMVPA